MDYRKECLYDVRWQTLRVSLQGRNNDTGGWGTMNGVEQNIRQLNRYLGASALDKDEFTRSTWRVLNLLNAVLLGYGKKRDTTYSAVKKYQETHSRIYAKYRYDLDKLANWNWEAVAVDLELISWRDPESFIKIMEDMQRRVKSAERKNGMDHRPELAKFLGLIEKIGRPDR